MKKLAVAMAVVLVCLCCVGCGGSSADGDTVQPPISADDVSGKNYQDVVTQFENAGFTAVETEGLGDLIVGFLHSEGEVEEVSIDGDVSYRSDAHFAPDAKVIVRYHSYPASSGEGEPSSNGAASSSSSESSASVDSSSAASETPDASGYVGKTVAEAQKMAADSKTSTFYLDKDGKDLTDVIENGSEKAAVRKAVVSKAEQGSSLFGDAYVELTLDYSAKDKVSAAKGKSAAKAASTAKNNGYRAEFLDRSGDDVTDEVTGSSQVKAARKATVTSVDISGGWSDTATFTLDYGVSKEFKTALRKAQSYCDTMHLSKAGLYDQLTSEYGEQYSADAAQYAVDNVNVDWNENALAMAKSYQDNLDMSPAAIYDQLVSEYGEQFTPEQAQYAIDHL